MAQLDAEETDSVDNPYVGPRTFRHGEVLFGRDREARDLTALIISHRLVLFYAPSGAGKSSLINTKVIPNLFEQEFEVLPVARVGGHSYVEGAHNIFTYNLVTGLHQEKDLPADIGSISLSRFLDNLVKIDDEYLYDETYEYGADEALKPRVLIIDQFEEILTTNTGQAEHRDGFMQQLNEALVDDPYLWIVLAMRDDFIAGLDPYLHYLPDRLRNRFYMQRLTRAAAMEAVCRPAELAGRPFVPQASAMLVDNLRLIKRKEESERKEYLDYVEPVQLQAVCYQMWEKLKNIPGEVITEADVELYADVDMALTSFYEDTIAATVAETGVSEIDLRNWFEEWFITDAGTRDMVFRGRKFTGDLPTTVADDVRGRFILRSVMRQEGTWYELVHDRLVHPIKSANRNWRLDQPLLSLAQHWEDSGRNPERLLDGRQLNRFLATDWESLGVLVTAFVEESIAVKRKEDAEIAAQKERDRQQKLEQQRALAEAEKARADAEYARAEEAEKAKVRQRTLMGIVIGLLIIGAIVTSFLAYQALTQRDLARLNEKKAISEAELAARNAQIAQENEERARAETIRANANLRQAQEAQAEAEAERERADRNAQAASELLALSEVQSLTDKTNSLRVGTHANDELSVLLGVEALRLKDELALQGGSLAARANTALRNVLQVNNFSTVIAADDPGITGLALSPDGRFLAGGGNDNTVRIYDLSQPDQKPFILEGPIAEVTAVAFSPDGSVLAAASFEEILLWDTADYDADPAIWPAHTGEWVNALVFSMDGQWLASGGDDGVLNLWTADQVGEPARVLNGMEPVWSLAFSPDGQSIAAGQQTGVLQVWNLADGEVQPRQLEGHLGTVYALAYAPDGSTLASGSSDTDIHLWDMESEQGEFQILRGHQGSVTALMFSAAGDRLASGSDDNNVHVWSRSLENGDPLILRGHSAGVRSVIFSADDLALISGGMDGAIRRWDLANQEQEPQILEGHQDWVRSIAMSDDGTSLASASDDNTVRIWNVNNPTAAPRILRHEDWVTAVAFAADGERLATGTAAGQLYLWDLTQPEIDPQLVDAHSNWLYALAFSRDGRILASAGGDGAVRLWEPSALSRGPDQLPGVDMEEVYALAISPDGSQLAAGGSDSDIRIWDLNEPDVEPRELKGHVGGVNGLAFGPDGRYLASGGSDATVIRWDLSAEDGSALVLPGHTSWVTSVSFSKDGADLASGSGDTTVLLWDLENLNDEPQLLEGHQDTILSVAFSPDGKTLASGSTDGTVRLWQTAEEHLKRIACERVNRNLTWQEAQEHLFTEEAYHLTCPGLPIHPSVAHGLSAELRDERWPRIESFLADLWGEYPAAAHQLRAQLPSALAERAYVQGVNGDYEDALALVGEVQRLDAQFDTAFVGQGMAQGWSNWQPADRIADARSFASGLAEEQPQLAAGFAVSMPWVFVSRAFDLALEGESDADAEALALMADARQLDPEIDVSLVGFAFAESWRERDWQTADRLHLVESFASTLEDMDMPAATEFRLRVAQYFVEEAVLSAQEGDNQQALALVTDAHLLDPAVDAAAAGVALADHWPGGSGLEEINRFAVELAEKAPTVSGPFQEQIAAVLIDQAVSQVWEGQVEEALATVDQARDLYAEVETAAVGQALAVNWEGWDEADRQAAVQRYVEELNGDYPRIAERFAIHIPDEFVLHAVDLVSVGDTTEALQIVSEAKTLNEGVDTTLVGFALAENWNEWTAADRVGAVESFLAGISDAYPGVAGEFSARIPAVFINQAVAAAEDGERDTAVALLAEARQLDSSVNTSAVGEALARGLQTVAVENVSEQIELLEEALQIDPLAAASFRRAIPQVLDNSAQSLAVEGQFEQALALMAETRQFSVTADLSGLGEAFARGWLDWDPESIGQSIASIHLQLAGIDAVAAGQFQLALATSLVERVHEIAQEGNEQEAVALNEAVAGIHVPVWDQTARDMTIATATGLVRGGEVERGLEIFDELQRSVADLAVSARQYNRFCWFGTLWGFPAEVRSYCRRAVDLQPENGNYRDSRGVMLAMMGEFDEAVESFEFYIQWAAERGLPEERLVLRMAWIDALKAGDNPFEDEALRAALREE